VPFDNVGLSESGELFRLLADLGYTDAWSSEAGGTDGFTPLALISAQAPQLRLGTAIVPAYLRGPALLAQTVAALAEAAPGRFALGIGTSSNVIVERWNGLSFDKPYQRVRDTIRFLKTALSGQKVSEEYETFRVNGLRLQRPPEQVPPILVAALRPQMLRLAGREGDGAILNWLAAEDVEKVVGIVHEGAEGSGKAPEIVARIFVLPIEDADMARNIGRMAIGAYLTVPVYAKFHEWLGRGQELAGLWEHWQAGDRQTAVQSIPDEVVDALIVHGSPEECRVHVQRYVDAGVTTPVMALLPGYPDLEQALRGLAPA
jgi:probable F420-dependent oxidoreductase